MARLRTQDAAFLGLETPESPMHIAALMTCRLPSGAGPGYMQDLHARLARHAVDVEPFNLRLVDKKGLGRSSWTIARDIDLDYHLRHEALPWPGGERELGLAVSRLHSTPLERSRPLWEFTLIEGLRPRRFALYLKIHHALGDGIGLMTRIADGLAESPSGLSLPPWSAPPVARRTPAALQAVDSDWTRFFTELLAGLSGERSRPKRAPLIPRGPGCVLNGDKTGRRRVATQRLSLLRIRAVARVAECTVNDVVLALCAGALRAYLAKVDTVPEQGLLASVPVALPRVDGDTTGTSVASMHASLATEEPDPARRLLAIRDAMRAAKQEFRLVPVSLQRVINTLGMQAMSMVPKLPNRDPTRAAFTNLTISNVPGPAQTLYFGGAEIDGMYPLSVLIGDHRLNVTVLRYRAQLHFGLVGCPDTLPGLQHLAVQLPVALRELESSLARTGRRRARAGAASRKA